MYYRKTVIWLIAVGLAIMVIAYGISFLRKPEDKIYKKIFTRQLERELAGPEKRLAELQAEAEKRQLTPEEENEVIAGKRQAEDIRKKYKAKIKPPPPLKPRYLSDKLFQAPTMTWIKKDFFIGASDIREWGTKVTSIAVDNNGNSITVDYQNGGTKCRSRMNIVRFGTDAWHGNGDWEDDFGTYKISGEAKASAFFVGGVITRITGELSVTQAPQKILRKFQEQNEVGVFGTTFTID